MIRKGVLRAAAWMIPEDDKMGRYEKHGEDVVFKQDDGDITAVFHTYEEKTELAHSGSAMYEKIFLILVTLGATYLTFIFYFF